jgi:hypothetical protein
MAGKEESDKFATEMGRRFDEFTKWAIENWPHKHYPLLSSDFSESRKEISAILGARLNDAQESPPAPSGDDQYVNINPAPWP